MFRTRILLLALAFAALFLCALGRLIQLQVIEGENYRQQRESRCRRPVQLAPRRGRIQDRRGRTLAEDQPAFDLALVPGRSVGRGRLRQVQSLLPDLPMPRLLALGRSRGERRALELRLIARDLETAALPRRLAELTGRPAAEVAAAIAESIARGPSSAEEDLLQARPCLRDIGLEAFLAVEQARRLPDDAETLAAIEPAVGSVRRYPEGEETGHLTGYVGPLTAEEYRELRGAWRDGAVVPGSGRLAKDGRIFFKPDTAEASILRLRTRRRQGQTEQVSLYLADDRVGRAGLESWYNQRLRGRHAERFLRLEAAKGKAARRLVPIGPASATPGEDLTLTIDLDLQKRVRAILRAELAAMAREGGRPLKGICVLLDPWNGRVLASVSEPSYDPNTVRAEFGRLLKDPENPLLDRVTAGQYPPGSVFKPVVGLSAITAGKLAPDASFLCEGSQTLGDHQFICMRRAVHGTVSVGEALMQSCNIFFYHAAGALGSRGVYEWAERFGFGHRAGVDLAGEAAGHLPSEAYRRKGWGLGQTWHLGIGQGPLTVTPLQVAVATAAIANGGRLVRPHLLLDPAGEPELDEPRAELVLSAAALEAVRHGMWLVVQGERGTARNSRIEGLEFAGKTGSAEWRKGRPTHAWFTCYAPYEKPQVVCVVLVPEGEFGGHTSAPIARKILMAYFGIPEEEGLPEEGAVGAAGAAERPY